MVISKNDSATSRFRENLVAMLKEQGLRHKDLAERLGVSRPSVTQMLSRDYSLTLDHAQRIADALKVPLETLISENQK